MHAHDLPVGALQTNPGLLDGCVVYVRVVELHEITPLLSLKQEEVHPSRKTDLVGLEITEERTYVVQSSLLPPLFYFPSQHFLILVAIMLQNIVHHEVLLRLALGLFDSQIGESVLDLPGQVIGGYLPDQI